MKKLSLALFALFIMAFIIYIPSISGNVTADGDEPEDYEYEYYYNNETPDESAEEDLSENGCDYSDNNLSVYGVDIAPDSYTVFVNKEYALPKGYEPSDLTIPDIPFYGGFSEEKSYLRKKAAKAVKKMFDAAKKDDVVLYAISGYRSYDRQKSIYDRNTTYHGSSETNKVSAVAGHSEHQTGLSLDISTAALDGRLTESFGDTASGRWVAKHCAEYGFIIRYPKGRENITGYTYEPWHIRYVGKKVAKYIYKNKITLEEYFNYTPPKKYTKEISSDVEITP